MMTEGEGQVKIEGQAIHCQRSGLEDDRRNHHISNRKTTEKQWTNRTITELTQIV